MFAKDANGNRVAYEGTALDIRVDTIDDAETLFKRDVRRVVELLHHWVCDNLMHSSPLIGFV